MIKFDYSPLSKIGLPDNPVGVKFNFFRPENQPQLADYEKLSLCEMLRKAQKDDMSFYFSKNNTETCVGKILLGMEDMAPFAESGQIGARLGIFDEARANQHFYQFVPKMERNIVNFVSFSPVDKMNFTPDVLVVSAPIEKAEIVMRASTFSTGDMYRSTCSPVMGCAWLLIQPYKTGEINYIVPSFVHGMHGRELYPSDHVLVGIPYNRIETLLNNLGRMDIHLKGHESKTAYYNEFKEILEDLSKRSKDLA